MIAFSHGQQNPDNAAGFASAVGNSARHVLGGALQHDDFLSRPLAKLSDLSAQLGQDFHHLSQHARLLTLTIPGIDLPWLVERFDGVEGIDTQFSWTIDLLLMQARISLDELLGRDATLQLLQADGSLRPFSGIVTQHGQHGSDGGLARYRITLNPLSHYCQLETNCAVFQDMTVEEITDSLFKRYPLLHYQWHLKQPLRKRSYTVQYNESNWDFLTRLWSEEGLSFYYTHQAPEANPETRQTTAEQADASDRLISHMISHTLHLVDADYDWPEVAPVRYGRISPSLGDDRINRLSYRLQAQPNSVTRSSWDYKTLHAPAGQASGQSCLPNVPPLEDYQGSNCYRYQDTAHAAQRARQQHLAYLQREKTYHGSGAVRHLHPGARFTLQDYGNAPDDLADDLATYTQQQRAAFTNTGLSPRLTLLHIHHQAANNLRPGIAPVPARHAHSGADALNDYGTYRNTFRAVHADTLIVPQPKPKPHMPMQSALITGIADNSDSGDSPASPHRTHTDRDHRVKIQFHWQRGSAPNPGGATEHPIPGLDNAPGDQRSSPWIRVVEWLAGPNWGSHFLPRIGDQVLVDFIDGDPDRPVVLGSLYNPQDIPPYSAGQDSRANHGGTISGVHSRSVDGQDYARLITDDASGQCRLHISTSYHNSQYNAGYQIYQPPHSSYRGHWRGTGFELKSDGWSTLRAARGLLLTTCARLQGQSTQLDSHEAIHQLKHAADRADQLTQAASAHQIRPHNHQSLTDYTQHLDHKYTQPVDGQSHLKPDGQSVECYNQPLIHLDTPVHASLTSAGSILSYAAHNTSQIIQQHQQQTAQHLASLIAGGSLSLYSDQHGIQLKAAHGPVSVQAHSDAMQISADQSVKIISVNDTMHIIAQRITLTAADSQIELDGANITFKTPGTFKVESSQQNNAPGAGQAGVPVALPKGTIAPQILAAEIPTLVQDTEDLQLEYRDADGATPTSEPVTLTFTSKNQRHQITTTNGNATLSSAPLGTLQATQHTRKNQEKAS